MTDKPIKSQVALVRCENYDESAVLEAVEKGIDLLGGISRFVKSGEKIVMKPNVLIGSEPEKCVTTHPSVFKAAGQILQKAGASVLYGDSSGFGSCSFNMKRAKLKDAADLLGFKMADFDNGRKVSYPEAMLIKNFVIANGVLDADGLVNLSKMKAHPLMRITGAVKNMFGCVPGMLKGQFHSRLPDPYDFATMLIDINSFIKPRLCIMDGIMAMEGNGPRSGTPKPMNVLIFSTDPVALDAVFCRTIGFDEYLVPTALAGERGGIWTYHRENIQLLGDSLESFIDNKFEIIRSAPDHCTTGRMRTYIKNRICDRPVIDNSKCTACGTCVNLCPVDPKAVDWHNGDKSKPPVYNYDRCIRCFCCQENCPEGAISVKTTTLSRLITPRVKTG
jgi:uncharacterized protein (DUF362 family)/Pyruvate/2-oxoacid:ferredoxin oxidoreductase delta subunit